MAIILIRITTAATKVLLVAKVIREKPVAIRIVTITMDLVARERPDAPVIGLTPNLDTARRMAVVWGVHAVVTPDVHSLAEAVNRASRWRTTTRPTGAAAGRCCSRTDQAPRQARASRSTPSRIWSSGAVAKLSRRVAGSGSRA